MVDEKKEKEEPRLMTIPEIAEHRGLSRQRVHRIAKTDPAFPNPVVVPGTTRMKYPQDAIDEYFETRVLQPGRRTDIEKRRTGEGASGTEASGEE
ncbi:helix-turn-helix transcriptional regulator [Streptomyces tanashiensis]|uniref:helix-turn-helix transcriptional regulator n=1 Tax=Streptomyces tanashiensis TaxID=67367 RepID=UPI0036E3BE5D